MKLDRWPLLAPLCLPLLTCLAAAQPPERGPAPAQAQAPAQTPPSAADRAPSIEESLPTVDLERLLDLATASSGKQFLVDARVSRNVHVRGADVPTSLTYPALLSILRNNGYAGVEIEGFVNIIPAAIVRGLPLPLVQEDDRDRPADEYVTRIIELKTLEAPMLVPLLRVMIPVEGHLAATPTKLIIVDRYANVRRITEIVRELDR